MGKTSIEWARNYDGTQGMTWNPVRGCTKVSPGCKHCYAETFAERFRGVPGHPYEQGFDPRLVPDMLDQPLRWKRPRTVFVNSMSDLFGEFVDYRYIAAVFGVMAGTPRHTYQVLTKRAARMERWFEHVQGQTHIDPVSICEIEASNLCDVDQLNPRWPLSNVWPGVSVEDRKYGLPRIEHLRRTPAAVRFLSIEPLLEDLGEIDLTGIDWVIVGGESGPGARPMPPAWVRSIRDQCNEQGVPFFFKQWGQWAPVDHGGVWIHPDGSAAGGAGSVRMLRHAHKRDAGRMLDGRTWDEMPARLT